MNATPHHSIREPQKVARLSRTFSHSLSAVDLAEPLRSLDETQPAEAARGVLQTRDLAGLGVRRGGAIAGWAGTGDLTGGTAGECAQEVPAQEVPPAKPSPDSALPALP